ncbi:MAG: 4Fe-4S binding protein [Elusimicrobiota bacterium]
MNRARLLLTFFLAGGFSQVVQALMGREMLVVFYGNEISLGLFYGFWLLWIAVGSWAAGRLAAGLRRPLTAFSLLMALLPAASAGAILLLRVCRRFIDVSPTQFVPLDQLALWSLAVTFPVGVLVGAAFPLACRALNKEEDIPSVYIFDALGGLAGGALFTFFLVDRISAWQTLGALSAALGLALLALPRGEGKAGLWIGRALGAAWAVCGLAVLLTPAGDRLTARADALRWGSILPKLELVETFDTPYQNLAIARLGDQTIVVADGKVTASFSERIVPAVQASLLFGQHPKAKRVLLVEGAAGGLIPELLKYPVERIDCVEPDERAFERIREHVPADWKKAFADKRVRFHFADPRLFFNRLADDEGYDLIVVLVPDPATASLNRFFTKEFYEAAGRALAGGGVFMTEVTSASNYLGREVKSYNASVYRTLREVFEDVRVTPGDSNYFFASDKKGKLTLDPAALALRYMSVRVRERAIPREAFFSILPKDRVAFVEGSLKEQGGELNTDLRPVTYYLNMLLWGRFSGSEWVGALETIRRVGGRFFLLPLVIFILFRLGYGLTEEDRSRERRFSAGTAIVALGFTAMALELVLLFTFQSFFGHIYKKVGLLNGLFMAGLASGAFAAVRAGAGRSAVPGRWLLAAAAAAAGYAWMLPRLLELVRPLGADAAEAAYWGLVFASGAFTGAGFPPAVRLHHRGAGDVGRTSGAIDAADHMGGMLGGLVTGTCLVPLLGVESSCRLAATGLALSCLPLILLELKGVGAVRSLGERLSGLPVLRFRERAFVSFPPRRTSWVLAGLAVTVWAMSAAVKQGGRPALVEFSDAELTGVTRLRRFERHEEPFPYYRGVSERGGESGAAFSTFPHSSEVKGYSGPINLLLGLSGKGEVLGLKLVESRETPSYIEGIDAWLSSFKGLDTTGTLRLGREIDALSGATVTSRAVVEIVNRSSEAVGERVLGLTVRRDRVRRPWTEPLKTLKFWVIAGFLALFFPVYLKGGERARFAYLAGAVCVMGIAYNTLFSLVDIANVSEGRLPGPDNAVWFVLAGFILITSLLWGQAYCGFVCPFGALQELLWSLGQRAGLKSCAMRWLDQGARYVKFLLLTAALCLFWITAETAWITFSPLQHFFALKFSKVMAILVGVALSASVLYFRFWCRYFCPAGAFLALSNKLALARRWAPKREFSLCDQGVHAEYDVDCLQCQRCVHHPAYASKNAESPEKKGS